VSSQRKTRERTPTRLGPRLSILAALIVAAVALVLVDPNALCVVPALLLVAPLLLRRYPGERLLLAARGAVPRRGGSDPARVALRTRRLFVTIARGGLLIARSLAVRPPPRSLPAS
jgi:hypothetical protein